MTALSVRWRIVVWFVALTALLLALFSATVYLSIRTIRMEGLDDSLRSRTAALAALVESDHGELEAEFDGELLPSSHLLGEMVGYEVFSHPGGELLVRSPSLGDGSIPLATTPVPVPSAGSLPPERPHELSSRSRTVTLEMGERVRALDGFYVVRSDWEDEEGSGPRVGEYPPVVVRVVVAEGLSGLAADLRILQASLALIGLFTLLIAVSAGYLLSRRIVDPLAAMAAEAEGIGVDAPSRRVARSGNGDETDRLAGTLNDAFDRLLEAYERQARFTADASHELRTPVSIIRTQAEVAARRTRSVEEYQQALATIIDGADRMQGTLEGLLLLARADGGDSERLDEPLDLADVAEAAAAEVSDEAAEGEVTLQVDTHGDCRAMGDARQLQIAVRNLLANAIRHCDAGSTVTVRLRCADGSATLEVDDRGDGIPAKAQRHVFERFYRVDKARARSRGGAGLGLSIVRTIVQQHGGTATLKSRVGEGTTVTLRLPGLGTGSAPQDEDVPSQDVPGQDVPGA